MNKRIALLLLLGTALVCIFLLYISFKKSHLDAPVVDVKTIQKEEEASSTPQVEGSESVPGLGAPSTETEQKSSNSSDCKEDVNCFIAAAKACKPAMLTQKQSFKWYTLETKTTAETKIIGLDGRGLCETKASITESSVDPINLSPADKEKMLATPDYIAMQTNAKKIIGKVTHCFLAPSKLAEVYIVLLSGGEGARLGGSCTEEDSTGMPWKFE